MKKRAPITWVNPYSFLKVQDDTALDGYRIPALFIHRDYLSFRSYFNGLQHGKEIPYDVEKTYQITQHQFIEYGRYWYEIIVDGVSKLKQDNTRPISFPSVRLFASDNFHDPFTSDWGSICNFKVQQGDASLAATTGKYFITLTYKHHGSDA